jgi:hypothetical protein
MSFYMELVSFIVSLNLFVVKNECVPSADAMDRCEE